MSSNGTRKETRGWEISSTGQMVNISTDDVAHRGVASVGADRRQGRRDAAACSAARRRRRRTT